MPQGAVKNNVINYIHKLLHFSDVSVILQVIALYHMGYDGLTESIINSIEKPEKVLSPILAITIQRLKRSLEHSSNQPEWIVSVPPHLYKRLQNTVSVFRTIRKVLLT